MPAIVGANSIMNDISDGDIIAMDGAEGVYVINPSSNELDEFLKNKEKLIEEKIDFSKPCSCGRKYEFKNDACLLL